MFTAGWEDFSGNCMLTSLHAYICKFASLIAFHHLKIKENPEVIFHQYIFFLKKFSSLTKYRHICCASFNHVKVKWNVILLNCISIYCILGRTTT